MDELAHRLTAVAEVWSQPTCTILWQRLAGVPELNALLDALLKMGTTPYEVYESTPGVHRSAYCEVRIAGCLGEAMLQYLGWSHRVVQPTVVTLQATPADLGSVLSELSAVTSVDYVLAR